MSTDVATPALALPVPPRACKHGVLNVLPERKDFLRAASARRQGTGSFMLQARDRRDDDPMVRIGFTASKKTGNAVVRARAKRRLRTLARELLAELGRPGWDYVLVSRPAATVSRDFADMRADLIQAFASVHRERGPRPERSAPVEAQPSVEPPAQEAQP